MATKRPSLGRGLEALLGSVTPAHAPPPAAVVDAPGTPTAQAPAPVAAAPRDEELTRIPVDLLQRGRYQPRLDMRPESLQELADSIRAQGVVQPIVVRPLVAQKAGEPIRYEIIAGERRWRAAQMAGLHDIPAVVRIDGRRRSECVRRRDGTEQGLEAPSEGGSLCCHSGLLCRRRREGAENPAASNSSRRLACVPLPPCCWVD